MADGMSLDFSEVTKLAADLGSVAGDIEKPLQTALNVTSLKVKKAAQTKVRSRKDLGQAASGITFDVKTRRGEIESEIGYDKDRGGVAKLGNLVEFGAPNAVARIIRRHRGKLIAIALPGAPRRPLPPGNELQQSLHEQEGDFVRGLEIAVADALKTRGL